MAAKKLYLVRLRAQASQYGLSAYPGCGDPVLAFNSRDRAAGRARELEVEARRVLPPFLIGEPEKWSSLGPETLAVRLEELGLRGLPKSQLRGYAAGRHWRAWWSENGGDLAPEQVEEVWRLLDAVEFYEVVEVPLKAR